MQLYLKNAQPKVALSRQPLLCIVSCKPCSLSPQMELLLSFVTRDHALLAVAFWFVAELFFYGLIRILASSVNKLTTPHKYKSCPEKLVRRILDNVDNMKTYDTTRFFSGWFMGADLNDVYLQNFHSFLAWVLFAKVFNDVNATEMIALESTATHIFERMSWTPKPGVNVNIQHVGMTVEDISYTHRPLLLYVMVYMKNALTVVIFHILGFQSRQAKLIHYWHREGVASTLEPVVFFHGKLTSPLC